MKKSRLLFLSAIVSVIFLFSVILCGCSRSSSWNANKLSKSPYEVSSDISIVNTGDNDGPASLKIKNDTGKDLLVGAGWTLEVKLDEAWYRVPNIEPIIVPSCEYSLRAGDTFTMDIDWKHYYDEIPEGTYRIVLEANDPDRNIVYGAYVFEYSLSD